MFHSIVAQYLHVEARYLSMKKFILIVGFLLVCFQLPLKASSDSIQYSSLECECTHNQMTFSEGSNLSENSALRNSKINIPVFSIRDGVKNIQRNSNKIQNIYFRFVPSLHCSDIHSVTFFLLSGSNTKSICHLSDYLTFRHLTI